MRLQPAGMNLPGDGVCEAIARLDRDYQVGHVEVLERALAIMSERESVWTRSVTSASCSSSSRTRTLPAGNAGFSELPGAVILDSEHDPWGLADYLIHEIHHHRLFVLEDLGPFFQSAQPADAGKDALTIPLAHPTLVP